MSLPTTVDDVISRLHEIDAELPADDGVAVFNRMYLTVTERIARMNSHIEHDLPISVVSTCRTRGHQPEDLHRDYETVNKILA